MSENGHDPLTVRHPDRQVSRTLTAVVRALTELAAVQPVRTITITQLVERAEIGRSTFYEHFDNLEGVLCWLVDELVEEMRGDDGQLRLDDLLTFVTGLPAVSRAFLEFESCARRCEDALAGTLPSSTDRARRFAAAGTMALLAEWLQTPDPDQRDELIRDATALVDAVAAR